MYIYIYICVYVYRERDHKFNNINPIICIPVDQGLGGLFASGQCHQQL